MAWNDQGSGGGGNGKDPWRQGGGGGRDPDGPPDLDELFRRIKKKFSDMSGKQGGGRSTGGGNKGGAAAGFFGVGFIVFILFAMWAISGIFIVRPAERAVVLRFGQYHYTAQPGPHWIPRFIDSYRIVNVEQRFTERYNAEMLTKDENIISVEMTAFYRIKDPNQFLYNVSTPVQSLQEVMRSALRQEVGNTELDSVLTTGREKIRENTFKNIESILSKYGTGLDVIEVNLQAVRPPKEVIDAFDDVQRATEDRVTYVNTAKAAANKVIEESKGRIQEILQRAEADRQEMIAQATGGVAGYEKVLSVYQNPALRDVTRERMYLETIESVLSQTSKVLLDTKGSSNMMYIPLDKLVSMQKAASVQTKQNQGIANMSTPLNSRPSNNEGVIQRNSRDLSSRRGY